jgi:hypothetical protein
MARNLVAGNGGEDVNAPSPTGRTNREPRAESDQFFIPGTYNLMRYPLILAVM